MGQTFDCKTGNKNFNFVAADKVEALLRIVNTITERSVISKASLQATRQLYIHRLIQPKETQYDRLIAL